MKIDYQLEFKKQLLTNISLVRDEINNTDFVFKITNHAEKFGREFETAYLGYEAKAASGELKLFKKIQAFFK
jgi:hypothetical protein